MSTPKMMTINRKTLSLDQWVAKTGIKKSTIFNRLARGWTTAQAVELEPRLRSVTGPKRKLVATHAIICPHCQKAFDTQPPIKKAA